MKRSSLRFYLLLAKQQQQVNDFLKYHAEYTELYQQRYAHNRELRDIMVSPALARQSVFPGITTTS